ncbi:hypothetical protein BH11ARM2_BH11ARM2_13450 [soil metagenome]
MTLLVATETFAEIPDLEPAFPRLDYPTFVPTVVETFTAIHWLALPVVEATEVGHLLYPMLAISGGAFAGYLFGANRLPEYSILHELPSMDRRVALSLADSKDTHSVFPVEFGDYTCSAYRKEGRALFEWSDKNSVVKVRHRHHFITPQHSGWYLALLLETVQSDQLRADLHRGLINSASTPNEEDLKEKIARLDKKGRTASKETLLSAERKVALDVTDGKALGIKASPTYVVIHGDTLWRCGLLEDAERIALDLATNKRS